MAQLRKPSYDLAYWNGIRQQSHERSKARKAPLKERLKVWFDYWTRHCSPVCENCGAPINRFNRDALYAAQAHILPKRESMFPSVCDERDNHLTLGGGPFGNCRCHDNFDASWSKAESMAVWPLAVERFKRFAVRIAAEEVRKLPDSLRNEYEKIQNPASNDESLDHPAAAE